jgi:hypothetical protein
VLALGYDSYRDRSRPDLKANRSNCALQFVLPLGGEARLGWRRLTVRIGWTGSRDGAAAWESEPEGEVRRDAKK